MTHIDTPLLTTSLIITHNTRVSHTRTLSLSSKTRIQYTKSSPSATPVDYYQYIRMTHTYHLHPVFLVNHPHTHIRYDWASKHITSQSHTEHKRPFVLSPYAHIYRKSKISCFWYGSGSRWFDARRLSTSRVER